MMKVLVSIDPPWPKRCYENSRGTDIGPRCRYYGGLGCRLGFNSPRNGERPTACIDAEEQAVKLAEDGETCRRVVRAIDKARSATVLRAIFEPSDRVTDALAAVLCGEVHSSGDRQA